MTFEELKEAAQVFNRINSIRSYVTKERFAVVAQTRFGIDDEDVIDGMYGMLHMTPRMVYYIANFGATDMHEPKRIKYGFTPLPRAYFTASSMVLPSLEGNLSISSHSASIST